LFLFITEAPELISHGYAYVRNGDDYVDKQGLKRQYWKCVNVNCKGRGTSCGLITPFLLTQCHSDWLDMDPTLAKVAENIKQAKLKGVQTKCKSNAIINDIIKDNDDAVLRKNPSHSAFKQVISREIKKNKVDNFKGPIDLKELIVPEHLKKTYRGKLFLLEDSNDEERVLLFSTEQNMKLLSSNSDCVGDGTFKILPLSFYQLFSVLVMINNYILPLRFIAK
jgi:hypothetical protein